MVDFNLVDYDLIEYLAIIYPEIASILTYGDLPKDDLDKFIKFTGEYSDSANPYLKNKRRNDLHHMICGKLGIEREILSNALEQNNNVFSKFFNAKDAARFLYDKIMDSAKMV